MSLSGNTGKDKVFAAVGLPKSLSGLCCVLCDSFVPFAKHQQTNLGFILLLLLVSCLCHNSHTRPNSGVMLLVACQKWPNQMIKFSLLSKNKISNSELSEGKSSQGDVLASSFQCPVACLHATQLAGS